MIMLRYRNSFNRCPCTTQIREAVAVDTLLGVLVVLSRREACFLEEFVENFQDFRDWLYAQVDSDTTEDNAYILAIRNVIEKFEELELDEAF